MGWVLTILLSMTSFAYTADYGVVRTFNGTMTTNLEDGATIVSNLKMTFVSLHRQDGTCLANRFVAVNHSADDLVTEFDQIASDEFETNIGYLGEGEPDAQTGSMIINDYNCTTLIADYNSNNTSNGYLSGFWGLVTTPQGLTFQRERRFFWDDGSIRKTETAKIYLSDEKQMNQTELSTFLGYNPLN